MYNDSTIFTEYNKVMVLANNLGFPRIGQEREFKFNTEKFWKGELNESQLKESLASLRAKNWQLQKKLALI